VAETQTWSDGAIGGGALGAFLEMLVRFGQRAYPTESVLVPNGALDSAEASGPGGFSDAEEVLGEPIIGVRALALLGLSGHVDEHLILDDALSTDVLAEFATLLRIACHMSEEANAGRLEETTWTFQEGTVLTRRVSGERFLILVGGPLLRTSLARYVMRQAAGRLASSGPASR